MGKVAMRVLFFILIANCVVADESAKLQLLPAEVCQVILVTNESRSAVPAEVKCLERQGKGWRTAFPPMKAVVGRSGIALAGTKREGDGCTPSGEFPIRTSFGYAENIATALDYRQAKDSDLWIDDPKSQDYNRWVQSPTHAASFEHMKREDDLYKLGAVIEYNTDPIVPGHGSAIFLHIWSGEGRPTAGCVALAENDVAQILKWLDRSKAPLIRIQSGSAD